MAENCRNCGLELFEAQRFCRACGAPSEQISDEHAATQMMPPQPETWQSGGARTAPTSRAETAPVYDSSAGYQPNVPPMYPASVPPYSPPRKRAPVGWILAFIGMGLFVLVVVAVMLMARFANRGGNMGGSQSSQSRQGEKVLDENNADKTSIVGTDNVLTKTFAVGDDARISLKNLNGNITITAWDQPNVEVNVLRRSGPDRVGSDRSGQVLFSSNGGNLSIRTSQTRANQEVRFEIKAPRELGRVEISSTNGVVRISDVRAEIVVDGTNGGIELINVVGVSKIHTTNGSIKATLLEASDHSMDFESTNGSIDLTVPPGFEANLEASTLHGTITIDDVFGVQVEKGVVGQKAKAEIGQGGERLRFATTNGNASLKAAEPRAAGSAKGKGNGN